MMNQRNLKRIFFYQHIFFGGMKIHSLQSLDSQKMLDVGRGCVPFLPILFSWPSRVRNEFPIHQPSRMLWCWQEPAVGDIPTSFRGQPLVLFHQPMFIPIYTAPNVSAWTFFCKTNRHRRKFRSQTSDHMGRWKAEQGRGREKRKIRREKSRRERVRRKKMQMREKVGKSRNTVFFKWFVAPEGRKVGSLKRRVRSPLARWEMKICTPLWREAHFQVKMLRCRKSARRCGAKHI